MNLKHPLLQFEADSSRCGHIHRTRPVTAQYTSDHLDEHQHQQQTSKINFPNFPFKVSVNLSKLKPENKMCSRRTYAQDELLLYLPNYYHALY